MSARRSNGPEHRSAGDVAADPVAVVLAALRHPDRIPADNARWETLIRSARACNLLGALASRLHECRSIEDVPPAPRRHLLAARITSNAQEAAVRRETDEIERALAGIQSPIILLKGAAYLIAELPPSRGRVFSDIDILVPKRVLPATESALMLAGYASTHHHPYDQRYYRRWMHELPPMRHVRRMTVIDVHHSIVPETSRVKLDAASLIRAAVSIPGRERFATLGPADMVLHSAVHLFHNEELTHGLRDLLDIDALLRHFGTRPGFWESLTTRATELDLLRPLYYALRWSVRLLEMPVPVSVLEACAERAPAAPIRASMDILLSRALRPRVTEASTRWARRVLYLRGHWLKMPVPLLAWHLVAKGLRREPEGPA